MRNTYDDVLKVFNQLAENEKRYISPRTGKFVESSNMVFRNVEYIKGKPVGFIEAYSFSDRDRVSVYMVYGIIKQYRHTGIASIMVHKLSEYLKNNTSYRQIIYECNKLNQPSLNAAKGLGFHYISRAEDLHHLIFVKDVSEDHVPSFEACILENAMKVIFSSKEDSYGYNSPEELQKILEKFRYDGEIGYVQTPNEFVHSKKGSCWDFATFIYWWLRSYKPNLNPTAWYVQILDGEDTPTHTWVSYSIGSDVYVIESAWLEMMDLRSYREDSLEKSRASMLHDYLDNFSKSYKKKYGKNPKSSQTVLMTWKPRTDWNPNPWQFMYDIYLHGKVYAASSKVRNLLKQGKIETILQDKM